MHKNRLLALAAPFLGAVSIAQKVNYFLPPHAGSPEMGELLLFSAIFRKMAKTHLHLPFPKMSNEIDSGLRGFSEKWRDLRFAFPQIFTQILSSCLLRN
jgi:hypothetical protein